MDAVWGKQLVSFAVGDVRAILEKQRDIAYTTVMTTVTRLYENLGGSSSASAMGSATSTPRSSRAREFMASTAREVLDEAVGGHQAMAMLAEKVCEASAGELDDLEALIQKRREELDA